MNIYIFDGDPSDFPQRQLNDYLDRFITFITSDASPLRWEEAYAELPVDPRTTYAVITIAAFENVSDDTQAPEFDGPYVDTVRVVLDQEKDRVPCTVLV